MWMVAAAGCALDVFLGLLLEGFLAASGTEVVGLALILRCGSRCLLVDIHAADWVFCHAGSPPFNLIACLGDCSILRPTIESDAGQDSLLEIRRGLHRWLVAHHRE